MCTAPAWRQTEGSCLDGEGEGAALGEPQGGGGQSQEMFWAPSEGNGFHLQNRGTEAQSWGRRAGGARPGDEVSTLLLKTKPWAAALGPSLPEAAVGSFTGSGGGAPGGPAATWQPLV